MGVRVLTVGSFDCLHSEHIDLFEWCRLLAGKRGHVIVGVNSDEFIKKTKGFDPVIPVFHRLSTVKSLAMVDEAFINDQPNLRVAITIDRPDVLIVGSDWHSRDYFAQTGLDWEFLLNKRCALVYAPSFGGVHSSDFRKKIDGS